MADVLSFRLTQRPVRLAAATASRAVCFFFLLTQMAGAGGLVSLLLGINDRIGQSIVVAVVGILMIIYLLIGGMKGTTWVQIVQPGLLVAGAFIRTIWVLSLHGFNLSAQLAAAADRGGDALLNPGLQYGLTGISRLEIISLAHALVFGTAGLPHVLIAAVGCATILAVVAGCSISGPADDPLLALLEALHYPRGPLEHVRRARLSDLPHGILAGRLG